jgi:peptidoglycan/xylan/chitin deacetylase (PgdA/CDA1 family)
VTDADVRPGGGRRRLVGNALLAAGALAAGALAVHAAPALTTITPMRRRLLPGLAGIGADPRHIAMTFDDGPDIRSTPMFLDLLDRLDVRATFFLLGRMVVRNRTLAKEIVAAGHEIGLHGYDHEPLINRSPAATRDDLTRGRDTVADACGQAPAWYRPPYGILTTAALRTARRLDLTTVLWTAWGRDWTARATTDSVVRTVTGSLAGGGTILLHDSDCTSFPESWRATLGAVPLLVSAMRHRGYMVGPLGEHRLAPTRG